MIQIKDCLLPLIGLSCNNCALAVEKFVQKLPGVLEASVDFAREKLSLTFDPAIVNLTQLIEAVRRIGYDVAIGKTELPIIGMQDSTDAKNLENLLIKQDGVINASVNYGNEHVVLE